MINIGLSKDSYPIKRCISGYEWANFKNYNKLNFNNYKNKLLKRYDYEFVNPLDRVIQNNIDAYCLFNEVANTKKPWLTIFETAIPRISETINFHRESKFILKKTRKIGSLLDRVLQDNCIGINSISENAKQIQNELLSKFPEYSGISDKLSVTRPPQALLSKKKCADFDGVLNMIFVGGDFYRKGGAELVIALDSLISSGLINKSEIQVTLIGNLNNRLNYALGKCNFDMDFYYYIERLIAKNGFEIIDNVNNSTLLEMMKNYHIGFLPSWADTYGFSVLEMMANGLPVVTTDVRALPEINLSDNLIKVDKNKFGEVCVNSHHDLSSIQEQIICGLKSKIFELYQDRMKAHRLSMESTDRIIQFHDPEKYFRTLSSQFDNYLKFKMVEY